MEKKENYNMYIYVKIGGGHTAKHQYKKKNS